MDTVKSADGTIIAYDQVGDGPPLIVSVGALCTRRTFVPPDDLAARFTVYTYDRRGRGDSGDTQPYAPEREYEDLAAVAAVCAETPSGFGHASGAAIALRAAARGVPMAALVADWDSEIAAAAAAVLPLSATTRKICSCRRVSRKVFMARRSVPLTYLIG